MMEQVKTFRSSSKDLESGEAMNRGVELSKLDRNACKEDSEFDLSPPKSKVTNLDPAIRIFLWSLKLKHLALILLVVQTVAAIVCLRVSLTLPVPPGGFRYLYTTQVFMSEVLKFVLSSFLVMWENENGLYGFVSLAKNEIIFKPSETFKVGVPALLYVVQNNLISVALENVSAAVYQITYQLKILSTGILSVIILKRQLGGYKWFSLFLLTGGVALIQLRSDTRSDSSETLGNHTVGITAVLLACLTSGFSGVYFEMILKNSKHSVWLRNMQLSLISIGMSLVVALWNDGDKIVSNGFFQGYNYMTWTVVLLQSVGGLIVAAVLKYADNILKCFGNAVAIVITCIISWLFLHDFKPSFMFVIGTFLVIAATNIYSLY